MATMTATNAPTTEELENLARLVRYYSMVSTTKAGSGHPTSSMSAADLLTVVFFREMQYNFDAARQPLGPPAGEPDRGHDLARAQPGAGGDQPEEEHTRGQ